METTIQISSDLKGELTKRKFFNRETYEEVIWDLIEDTQEINNKTKKELAEAREEAKKGNVHTLSEVKKELKIDV